MLVIIRNLRQLCNYQFKLVRNIIVLTITGNMYDQSYRKLIYKLYAYLLVETIQFIMELEMCVLYTYTVCSAVQLK